MTLKFTDFVYGITVQVEKRKNEKKGEDHYLYNVVKISLILSNYMLFAQHTVSYACECFFQGLWEGNVWLGLLSGGGEGVLVGHLQPGRDLCVSRGLVRQRCPCLQRPTWL